MGMQSANILIDTPVVASQPQKPTSGAASIGGGEFDRELREQQQQLTSEKPTKTEQASDRSSSDTRGEGGSTSDSTTEASSSHKREQDGENATEGANDTATTDNDASSDKAVSAIAVAQEAPKEVKNKRALDVALELSEPQDGAESQLSSELLLSNESTLGEDQSGNILPPAKIKNGEEITILADGPSDMVMDAEPIKSHQADIEQISATASEQSESMLEPAPESVINVQSKVDAELGAEVDVELISGEEVKSKESTTAVAIDPTMDELDQIDSIGARAADIDSDLQQFAAPLSSSLPQTSNVERTVQTAAGVSSSALGAAVADALANNRSAGFTGGQSAPNHQQFSQTGGMPAAAEAIGTSDKPAEFLAALKSMAKGGAEQSSPSQSKSQPVVQLSSLLGGITASSTQGQTINSVTSAVNGAASLDTSPAMMSITTSMRQQGWDRAMGERLVFMARNGVQEAKMQVTPRHMGPIDIKVSVNQEQQANVTFVTTNSAARETIDAAMPRLREMFDQAGLNLAESEVSQRHPQQDQKGESAGDERGGNDQFSDGRDRDSDDSAEAQIGYVRPSGLDLFA